MRVLVRGHLGYIGTVMVPMLLRSGHEVIGLDSDLNERCFTAGGSFMPVPHLRKDVRDADANDLMGSDAVIKMSALSREPLGKSAPPPAASTDRASVRLARLAKETGVKQFLFASSSQQLRSRG
jgi:nucleoside-diphosphate-sugar epimerase